MQVQIIFNAKDLPEPQILHADLSRDSINEINAAIASPDADRLILYIDCRVKVDGPTKEWMFRANLITLRVL